MDKDNLLANKKHKISILFIHPCQVLCIYLTFADFLFYIIHINVVIELQFEGCKEDEIYLVFKLLILVR